MYEDKVFIYNGFFGAPAGHSSHRSRAGLAARTVYCRIRTVPYLVPGMRSTRYGSLVDPMYCRLEQNVFALPYRGTKNT
jgi:hypothetical protein